MRLLGAQVAQEDPDKQECDEMTTDVPDVWRLLKYIMLLSVALYCTLFTHHNMYSQVGLSFPCGLVVL